MREKLRNVYKNLVGKSEEESAQRPRHRWDDNKIDLREIY
jgi:hypothetical protein